MPLVRGRATGRTSKPLDFVSPLLPDVFYLLPVFESFFYENSISNAFFNRKVPWKCLEPEIHFAASKP